MSRLLNVVESMELLNKKRFSIPKYFVVSSVEEAVNAAKKIGFPVVLKIVSSKHSHKTEVGGVVTNLKNEEDIRKNFLNLSKLSKKIVVQKMISGFELILGSKKDPVFGPVVMFGIGGILVEVFKDVSFRVAPVCRETALEMMKEIHSHKILEGFRGIKVNRNSLVKSIINFSEFIANESILEADINPLIVNEQGAFVVDARLDVA